MYDKCGQKCSECTKSRNMLLHKFSNSLKIHQVKTKKIIEGGLDNRYVALTETDQSTKHDLFVLSWINYMYRMLKGDTVA